MFIVQDIHNILILNENVSVIYTISLLLQLELDNYLCDNKVTLSEIRDHSIEIGASEGVHDQCWGLLDIRYENLL